MSIMPPPRRTRPGSLGLVRRRDITIEVDRSQEFIKDAVFVRGKLRAAPAFPYPEAIVKIMNVPTRDPTATPAAGQAVWSKAA
jgi:hypothetical protein